MNNDYPISKTVNTDVLVVGAGDSGMMAAAAPTEAGAKVTGARETKRHDKMRESVKRVPAFFSGLAARTQKTKGQVRKI